MKKYKTVLSIAGSDSIGGAGIQADIKTCCSLGVYAMTAVTAVTAQNSTGVKGFAATHPHLLRLQLDSVLTDVVPDAVKIGMLPNSESALIVAEAIDTYKLRNIVIDPVMIATSGHALSDNQVKDILLNRLIAKATIVTPNIPETEVLTATGVSDINNVTEAGKKLVDRYPDTSFLIKGGHCPENGNVSDTLFTNGNIIKFNHKYITSRNTHGTGCSLSSAIAAYLAIGHEIPDAVSLAIEWEYRAIESGAEYEFGTSGGHGPINHLFNNSI